MTVTTEETNVTATPAGSPGAAGDSIPSRAPENSHDSGGARGPDGCGPGPTEPLTDTPKLYGVYPALVVDLQDPDGIGRLQVSFPWLAEDAGKAFTAWARLAQFAAGADRGAWFMPEVDDEVLVAFEAGDVDRPYVIGALWNGVDRPPVSDGERGDNEVKRIRTRSGASITFDDTPGQTAIIAVPSNRPPEAF